MRPQIALATALSLGCALAPGGTEARPTSVLARSHNKSAVDVYLLCGARNAVWLGAVSKKGAEPLEIPAADTRCAQGLSFFLVHQNSGRGYWVGPIRAMGGEHVDLVIEKLAAMACARVLRGAR